MRDQKKCIVCTMPLVKGEDYPKAADPQTTNYCKHCGTKDGLHPYKALIEGMAGFMMKTQGMVKEQAQKAAKEMIDNSEAVKMGVLEIES